LPTGSPTDPYERISRIRFFQSRFSPQEPGRAHYPSLFRAHVYGSLCILQVSSRRFRDRAGPFPTPRLQAAPFAEFLRYDEPAKTPVTPLPVLPGSVEPNYLELAPAFRSTPSGSPDAVARRFLNRFIPFRCFVPRTPTGLPCSQGTLRCLCPVLRPRPDSPRLAKTARKCCPRPT